MQQVGRPQAAWNMGRQLTSTGAFVGIFNSLCAAALLILAPFLFTSSQPIMSAIRGTLPIMCLTLIVHTSSMATEGMLLAGEPPEYGLFLYIIF